MAARWMLHIGGEWGDPPRPICKELWGPRKALYKCNKLLLLLIYNTNYIFLLTCAPSLHLLLHHFLSLWLSGIVSQLSTKQTSFPLFLYNPLSASWAWLRPGFVQKTQQLQLPSLTISLSLTPHVRLAGVGALVCSFQIIGNTQPTRPWSNGSCTDLRLPGGHLSMDERKPSTAQPGKDWASCLPCNSNSTAWFHDSVRFVNNYPISFGQKSWCNLRWPADLQRAHCKDCSILQVCTTQHQKDQALSDRACCTTSCPGPCHF